MDGLSQSSEMEKKGKVLGAYSKKESTSTNIFLWICRPLQQHRICQRIFFHLHPYLHLLWFCLHFDVNVYLSDCPHHHLQPLEEFHIGKIATSVHVIDTERRPQLLLFIVFDIELKVPLNEFLKVCLSIPICVECIYYSLF